MCSGKTRETRYGQIGLIMQLDAPILPLVMGAGSRSTMFLILSCSLPLKMNESTFEAHIVGHVAQP